MNFRKKFDWISFNRTLVQEGKPNRRAIAIDPSYISKSGKKTPGVGYFWSGCASAVKWGLGLMGFTLHSAAVWAVSLKREVKVVIAEYIDPEKKTQTRKVFFSTDTDMSAIDIFDIYRTRFQIEFLSTATASSSQDYATASQGMSKPWTLHSICPSPQSTLPDSLERTMAWICPLATSSCSYTMLQWLNEYFQRSETART